MITGLKKYECAILISNDSDFSEALKLLRSHKKVKIGLFTPNRTVGKAKVSQELKKYTNFRKLVPICALRKNQLPRRIPGTNIVKPSNW